MHWTLYWLKAGYICTLFMWYLLAYSVNYHYCVCNSIHSLYWYCKAPFSRSIANSSNSCKDIVSVGGKVYNWRLFEYSTFRIFPLDLAFDLNRCFLASNSIPCCYVNKFYFAPRTMVYVNSESDQLTRAHQECWDGRSWRSKLPVLVF